MSHLSGDRPRCLVQPLWGCGTGWVRVLGVWCVGMLLGPEATPVGWGFWSGSALIQTVLGLLWGRWVVWVGGRVGV